MAFLTVQAGGMATTGYEEILSIKPEDIHQRVLFSLVAKKEIQQMIQFIENG